MKLQTAKFENSKEFGASVEKKFVSSANPSQTLSRLIYKIK